MASTEVIDIDRGWRSFKKRLARIGQSEVVVGIPGEIDFSVPNTAAIGMVHEFGSTDGTIPERSFLRSTFDANRAKYDALLERLTRKQLRGGINYEASLFRVGETARGDVIKRIKSKEITQGLAPSTIARKGSDTALVDTGALVGSIVSKVRKAT